jgi:hypothetical protein
MRENTMEPDESETLADLGASQGDKNEADKSDDSLGIVLDQDSTTADDVDLDVMVAGSKPASVELDAELDQQGELDQDADVESDAGEAPGRNIDVEGSQRPEVDQRIDVDVEISEGDDGTIIIEVDVDVEDDVEIESDAEIDVSDDDEDSIGADIEQDTEIDGNVDVDVEIRDDLDADALVDVGSILEAMALGIADIDEDDDATQIYVDLDDYAGAYGDVDILVDVSDPTDS